MQKTSYSLVLFLYSSLDILFLPIDLVTEVDESLASPYGAALLFTYFGPLDSRNGYVCKWAGKNLMNLMKQLLMIFPTIMHPSMCQAETGLQ